MSTWSAEALVGAPRGRALCMEIATLLDDAVHAAGFHAGLNPGDDARRRALIAALGRVDPSPLAAWHDPLRLVAPVTASVDLAMYWQEPRDQDVATALPGVADALLPIAAAVVVCPAAAWWTAPADLGALRCTDRYAQVDPAIGPVLAGARGRLADWRDRELAAERRAAAERPADPTARFSGTWWSTPVFADLPATTRPLGPVGSLRLVWEEDSSAGPDALIWSLRAEPGVRVLEIDGPDAWAALVGRFPLEVGAGRRHDWYRTTGRVGRWAIPDWPAVAERWDAVHVSVAGYLTTATRAIDVGSGLATVLAGWEPDTTWWLTDTVRAESGPPSAGTATTTSGASHEPRRDGMGRRAPWWRSRSTSGASSRSRRPTAEHRFASAGWAGEHPR